MIDNAKRKKSTKTDKSKVPKAGREGKVHMERKAAVGKQVCPRGMTQKTPMGDWEVSPRISVNPMEQVLF